MNDKENEEFSPDELNADLLDDTNHNDDAESAQKPDYEGEIINIIRGNLSPKIMRDRLEDYHGNDISEILPELSVPERKKLFRILSTAMLSEIFEYSDEDDVSRYLDEMDLRKAARIISNLETDTALDVLREIEKSKRELLIDLMDIESQRDIALIASFDEDEIGSRLTTNYIVIRENLSVKEAMNALVEQAAKNDNISVIFVVDETGSFYGAIDLKDLIIARRNDNLSDLIITSFPYVYGHEDIDACIEKLKDYSESSIPVLDNANRLIGVITAQNIIEVVDEEMGEDYAKLAGLTAEEDLQEPLKQSMKKRLPWLLLLLGLGMVVSTVTSLFEPVVSKLTIVMAFQSLILGMSGNVGTQSLAVTIRVLVDENLTPRNKIGLVFKEMRVGLSNGLILGSLSFIVLGLYLMLLKNEAPLRAFSISGCIGISLALAMLISGATGTLVPLFFNKIKIDPAVASGPLITTMNDLVAVVTYYSMCWILLLNVMHLAG